MPASRSTPLPAFALQTTHGEQRAFPTGRPAVLAFVKEDCPTCALTLPSIEQMCRAFSADADVLAIGQDGLEAMVRTHELTLPMLDDTALAVSFDYDIDTVPTLILATSDGRELRRIVGFDNGEWQDFARAVAAEARAAEPEIAWELLPDLRPGCGSKSVEPGVAEQLAARAAGSPLRARQIEIAEHDDPFEFMFEQGYSDGLPLVPPTPERVLRMLAGTRRDPQSVVAIVPPNMAPLTVEKLAVNAVMAGCKSEYLPVVIAAIEAVCTEEFNIHGVLATTWGATPVMVVNGPIRHAIGMNMGLAALGSGNRANATIGRAVKLALRNVGGAKPGGVERSTLASPGKFTMCFAEWEERSCWEPLHVERGFAASDNVVTVFGIEASPHGIADQTSRSARALGGSLGAGVSCVFHPKLHGQGEVLLVVCPEHVDTIARDGWSKDDVRGRMQEVTARPLRDILADEEIGEGMLPRWYGPDGPPPELLEKRFPKFRDPKNINIVVAGGEAGKFSAVFGGWVSGPMGSNSVSRKIEEAP